MFKDNEEKLGEWSEILSEPESTKYKYNWSERSKWWIRLKIWIFKKFNICIFHDWTPPIMKDFRARSIGMNGGRVMHVKKVFQECKNCKKLKDLKKFDVFYDPNNPTSAGFQNIRDRNTMRRMRY